MKNEETKKSEKLSTRVTSWIGTPASLLVHTILFMAVFALKGFGYTTEDVLLILTTAVSLEAIYLSIFIQMTVNRTTKSLEDVEESLEDVEESLEDVEEDIGELKNKNRG